jgi:flavorubredoxin
MGVPAGERALVLYGSVFGNTEKVALALARGIRRHTEVDCISIKDADAAGLSRYRLIAVGAPTQAFSAYKPMKDFLSKVDASTVRGKLGFAFDTKIDSRLSGSASKYIEKRLQEFGVRILRPRESAIVSGGTKDNVLREGEETRFEALGDEVGKALEADAVLRD